MQGLKLLGPLHFGEALMLAAGLHGQIWTIVPDKPRSKFLQAVPKPPHIGSDNALPLLYTGGLWAKLPSEVKADLGVLLIHVPPGHMLIINKASPLVTKSGIMCMHAHKSHFHALYMPKCCITCFGHQTTLCILTFKAH